MLPQNYFSQIEEVDLTPLTAFQIYGSVKLHFTNPKFDYTVYGDNKKSFNNTSLSNRNDLTFFKRLSETYQYKNRFLPVVVASMYEDTTTFSKDLLDESSKKRGMAYRAYMKNPTYAFKSEITNLVLGKHIMSVNDLYSPNTKLNYFSLASKKLIHPLTASILNNLYYTKYLANTSLSFVYQPRAEKLNKLYSFLTEDVTDGKITELFVIDIIKTFNRH